MLTYNLFVVDTNPGWPLQKYLILCIATLMPVFYPGKRTLPAIIQWLKRHASPGVPVLDSVDAVAQFVDSHKITIVGFFEVRP